jgi:dihydrofolate reductase
MRKMIESTLVSADGVIGEPHIWTGEHFGEQAVSLALEQLERTDAMVMGRHTYEMFKQIWGKPEGAYSAAIYNMRKYVFSSTLEEADWNHAEIVRGDVAAAVTDLKQQEGKDIVLYGHGPVGQALLEAGLLDELKLWVHPVVVGSGNLPLRRLAEQLSHVELVSDGAEHLFPAKREPVVEEEIVAVRRHVRHRPAAPSLVRDKLP